MTQEAHSQATAELRTLLNDSHVTLTMGRGKREAIGKVPTAEFLRMPHLALAKVVFDRLGGTDITHLTIEFGPSHTNATPVTVISWNVHTARLTYQSSSAPHETFDNIDVNEALDEGLGLVAEVARAWQRVLDRTEFISCP